MKSRLGCWPACPGKKKENEDGMTIRKAEDFGRWYSELVVKSEMIDYSDISGALRQPAHLSRNVVLMV